MKYVKKLMFCLLVLFVSFQPARACIDYTDSVRVRCDYDSVTFNSIAIRVSNLRFFGGNPTHFCSCAISNYTNVFTNITYIAFVDSGTNTPVGFVPWAPNANASAAWETVVATGDWNGFVAQVGASGLLVGQEVELIIRAELPPGYYFSLLDSALYQTHMGTDEWSNSGQVLANSHQQVLTWANDWPATYVAHGDLQWFADLDNDILNSRKDENLIEFNLFPVPARSELNLQISPGGLLLSTQVEVLDLRGQLLNAFNLEPGHTSATIPVGDLAEGIYLLRLVNDNGSATRRFAVAGN